MNAVQTLSTATISSFLIANLSLIQTVITVIAESILHNSRGSPSFVVISNYFPSPGVPRKILLYTTTGMKRIPSSLPDYQHPGFLGAKALMDSTPLPSSMYQNCCERTS